MPKNKLIAIAVLGIIGLSFVAFSCYSVYAEDYGLGTAASISGLAANQVSQTQSIPLLLGTIVSILLSLIGIIFFIMILFAGFTWMTAAGSTEKVEIAKKRLQNSVIGLVAVLAAYTIANFVFQGFLQPGNVTCATTPAGEAAANCARGEVCDGSKCVNECDYVYKKLDSRSGCIDISTEPCDGIIKGGECAGEINIKCCVTTAAEQAFEQAQANAAATGATKPPATPAQVACDKIQGGFCASLAACTGQAQNGQSMGQQGCGAGQICCQTCAQAGGTCIDTSMFSCNDPKNQKSGFCHGQFKDQKYKCCIGSYGISVQQ